MHGERDGAGGRGETIESFEDIRGHEGALRMGRWGRGEKDGRLYGAIELYRRLARS